jgi:hypothetical protein
LLATNCDVFENDRLGYTPWRSEYCNVARSTSGVKTLGLLLIKVAMASLLGARKVKSLALEIKLVRLEEAFT